MITRDVAQIRPVHAVMHQRYDASCGSNDGTTSNEVLGLIIDRLGLGRQYNSALLHAYAWGDIGTSTVNTNFMAVGGRLLHSSTTCADDFDELSTGNRPSMAPLFLTGNTTSTLASGYMATSTATGGTFGVFSATATGAGAGEAFSFYDIGGANRFLRGSFLWQAEASSSGGSVVEGGLDLGLGAVDLVPHNTTSTTPVFLTTCNSN